MNELRAKAFCFIQMEEMTNFKEQVHIEAPKKVVEQEKAESSQSIGK